ncbi:MAG: cytochrome c oxidase subunit 3 family protein [Phycisphaerales bacterium]|nr:cytochrome c oxidase subunit 3 family protein [Phycisphaerales bacterium]
MSHDHDHDHDHPSFLAHHWDNAEQQFEAGKFGMWLFLATEVLLFGGLFAGYAVWRHNHHDVFAYGSKFLNTMLGATNTAVLLASSMTMAMAVTFAQRGKTRALQVCLVLTLLGAVGFMVIKYFEYTHKFHEGLYPGVALYGGPPHPEQSHLWNPDLPVIPEAALAANAAAVAVPGGLTPPAAPVAEPTTIVPPAAAPTGLVTAFVDRNTISPHMPGFSYEASVHPLQDPERPAGLHVFFNIYYMMTGLHGIHVIVGGIVITWLLIRSTRGEFSGEYFTPVDLGGLYWHVVDLIWIFLFPLFYLI